MSDIGDDDVVRDIDAEMWLETLKTNYPRVNAEKLVGLDLQQQTAVYEDHAISGAVSDAVSPLLNEGVKLVEAYVPRMQGLSLNLGVDDQASEYNKLQKLLFLKYRSKLRLSPEMKLLMCVGMAVGQTYLQNGQVQQKTLVKEPWDDTESIPFVSDINGDNL